VEIPTCKVDLAFVVNLLGFVTAPWSSKAELTKFYIFSIVNTISLIPRTFYYSYWNNNSI